jgi:hypothetical protein
MEDSLLKWVVTQGEGEGGETYVDQEQSTREPATRGPKKSAREIGVRFKQGLKGQRRNSLKFRAT